MYDDRMDRMLSMVKDLNKYNDELGANFQIMSDEDFYNSEYGASRRARGHKAEKEVFLHVLYPNSKLNLMGIHFKKKVIAFAVASEFNSTIPDILDKHYISRQRVKNHVEYRTTRFDYSEMYNDALELAKWFMNTSFNS